MILTCNSAVASLMLSRFFHITIMENKNIKFYTRPNKFMKKKKNLERNICQMTPSTVNYEHSLILLLCCPCYVVIHICDLFEWKRICAHLLFIYVLLFDIQLSRGEGWDPTCLTLPHFYACPDPGPGPGFQIVICHGLSCVQ